MPLVASAQEGCQSPRGNINCAQWGDELRCDIQARSYTPPSPREACALDYGNAVGLTSGGPRMLCSGNTIANPRHPVLPYGTAWQGKGVTCKSLPNGVRCINAAGRGFELARARLGFS